MGSSSPGLFVLCVCVGVVRGDEVKAEGVSGEREQEISGL